MFFAAIGAMWLAPFAQRVAGGKALPLAIILVALGMLAASVGSGVTDVLINARVAEIEARSGRTLMNLNHAMYSFAYAGAALLAGVLREAQVDLRIAFAGLVVVLLALACRAHDVIPNIEDDDVGGGRANAACLGDYGGTGGFGGVFGRGIGGRVVGPASGADLGRHAGRGGVGACVARIDDGHRAVVRARVGAVYARHDVDVGCDACVDQRITDRWVGRQCRGGAVGVRAWWFGNISSCTAGTGICRA